MKSLPLTATFACLVTQSIGAIVAFQEQSRCSRYAFFAGIVLLIAGLAIHWDRKPRALTSRWTASLCIACLLLPVIAIAMSIPWFNLLGFAITISCVVNEQADREGRPLSKLTFFAVLLCCVPSEWESNFLASAHASAVSTVSNLLQFSRIPHLISDSSISLAKAQLEIGADGSFGESWQLFLVGGIVWSVLMHRNQAVSGMNVISAVFWWWGWLCITLLLPAFVTNAPPVVLSIASYVSVVLLFLSTERAVRGFFAPVTDGTGDKRQANPLIAIWNRIDQTRDGDGKAKSDSMVALPRSFVVSLLSLSLLGLILQATNALGLLSIGDTPAKASAKYQSTEFAYSGCSIFDLEMASNISPRSGHWCTDHL